MKPIYPIIFTTAKYQMTLVRIYFNHTFCKPARQFSYASFKNFFQWKWEYPQESMDLFTFTKENFNPFHTTTLFIHPLKTENLWFSDVFREYRKTSDMKWVKENLNLCAILAVCFTHSPSVLIVLSNGAKYSRMDQVKFVKDNNSECLTICGVGTWRVK